jgi:hypothetical protein
MPITVYDPEGNVLWTERYRCEVCARDQPTELVFLSTDLVPHDIPIRCVYCRRLLASFHPEQHEPTQLRDVWPPQLIKRPYPICESPGCAQEAIEDRRGIALCERHASYIDRCFPSGASEQ